MLRNHGPDDAYNMYPLKIQNSIFFYHFPQAQQFYSIETLYLPGYTIRGAVLLIIKTLHKTYCNKPTYKNKNIILGLEIKTVDYNKPNYLWHPTSCLYSHLQQLYSISHSWQ